MLDNDAGFVVDLHPSLHGELVVFSFWTKGTWEKEVIIEHIDRRWRFNTNKAGHGSVKAHTATFIPRPLPTEPHRHYTIRCRYRTAPNNPSLPWHTAIGTEIGDGLWGWWTPEFGSSPPDDYDSFSEFTQCLASFEYIVPHAGESEPEAREKALKKANQKAAHIYFLAGTATGHAVPG